ncbi:MAG: 16S rRNA (adenine(1518)-N(6)/adenine(1519)-N(6))-dimethyltransferase RsmA [Clostridia bacterium]|nr:16S rRNA (adenine(1518)-N(6)/adenine(1519)-N(6))-dimethyltransferase RsmA [Clostridia bacterium]
MNLLQETKFIMDKYGIQANKSLGQNFLIDENIVNDIVDKSNINISDLVIEIGPGLGTLTSKLLEKAGKVIAIELDKKVLNILNERFVLYKNFELINNDILKVDLNDLINKNLNEQITTCKIVANLPYYITTPIIMKLLQENLKIDSITVMVQKEVAERLTAIPGEKDAGSITYSIYYYTEPKIVLNVPRNCFLPVPDVNSSVISLKLLKNPRISVPNEEVFFHIIKSAFSQKRKTLVNSLVNNKIIDTKESAEKLLNSIGLDTKIRAEKLTIENFAELSKKIALNK